MRLRPGLFPEDFFRLKKKKKQDGISADEEQQIHDTLKQVITGFPLKSGEELFGQAKPYKILLWGSVQPGEMDRHIRGMRREERQRTAGETP